MNNIAKYLYRSALAHPDRQAVKCEADALTYEGFNAMVGRLRRFLSKQVPFPRGKVAMVFAYKSPHAVAFMQAALRCGMVYSVIDPRYPVKRVREILADSAPAVLFTDQDTAKLDEISDALEGVVLINAGDAGGPGAQTHLSQIDAIEPDLSEPEEVAGSDLAYILYTSGSTGVPKGVRITHANAAFSIDWAQDEFQFDASEVFLNQAHLGFDFCVLDHYNAWNVGASVILVPEYNAVFPVHVVDLIREEGVTNLWLVPSNIVALIKQGGLLSVDASRVRRFLYGGEPFQMPYLREIHAWMKGRDVFNLYGPTETNLVTAHRVSRQDLQGDSVPLGFPIPGATLKVQDQGGALADSGMGELWALVPSVAAGYTNRPDLNASRFVTDESGTWYRTGDVAEIDERGMLWYRGRVDDMVKVRGFRIELKEVEKALLSVPGLSEATLVVRMSEDDDKEIHAFCVGHNPDERAIRRHLATRLPPFMVPKRFHFVPDIPYNDRGKVDRGALMELVTS